MSKTIQNESGDEAREFILELRLSLNAMEFATLSVDADRANLTVEIYASRVLQSYSMVRRNKYENSGNLNFELITREAAKIRKNPEADVPLTLVSVYS